MHNSSVNKTKGQLAGHERQAVGVKSAKGIEKIGCVTCGTESPFMDVIVDSCLC